MRAAPNTVVEKRAHAEPMDAGARYFRFTNISDLFNQMVRRFRQRCAARYLCGFLTQSFPVSRQLAIKEYQGLEVVNPGFLDDLRADAAVAAADMNSAYGEYVRLRGRCHTAQR